MYLTPTVELLFRHIVHVQVIVLIIKQYYVELAFRNSIYLATFERILD